MADDRVSRAVVDAGVLIALLNREEGRWEKSRDLVEDAEEGRIELWAPMVIQVEVCRWSREVDKADPEARANLEDFIENEWLNLIEVDRQLSRVARDVVATTTVRTGVDALYVAAADRLDIDVVYAWDDRVIETVYKNVRGAEPPGSPTPKLDFAAAELAGVEVPPPEGEPEEPLIEALGEGGPLPDEYLDDDGIAEQDV